MSARPGRAAASSAGSALEPLALEILDALSRGDVARFAELIADEIEIHTSRGIRRGRVEAEAWAANKYDHLLRRYGVDELRTTDDGRILVYGRTEYVWKQGGELADASPVVIELAFRHGRLVRWRFREQPS